MSEDLRVLWYQRCQNQGAKVSGSLGLRISESQSLKVQLTLLALLKQSEAMPGTQWSNLKNFTEKLAKIVLAHLKRQRIGFEF